MQKRNTISTRNLVCCALLAALSVVMARLLCFATPDGVRWSADKFPLFLAGMLFGPVLGGLTGFTADFLGSIMQFGFNPMLCPPAILYGIFGGEKSCCSAGNNQVDEQAGITQHRWQLSRR